MAVQDVNSNNTFISILKSFNRSTTINDMSDLMSKSLFMMFDLKDEQTGKCDGKFNDKEWTAFEKFRNNILKNFLKNTKSDTLTDKQAVEYYNSEVEKIEKNIADLIDKNKDLYSKDYFQELSDYGELHNVRWHCLKDGETNPEGTKLLDDIETFGIGIPNIDKGACEGIYKRAYIEGFENLTPEEQKEYMDLYSKAMQTSKQIRDFEENVLSKEIEKLHDATIMLGATEDGKVVGDFLSKEVVDEKRGEWEAQNPFLKQIENLEIKIAAERVKFHPNVSKINELQSMLTGYYQLSEQWRLSFTSDEECNPKGTTFSANGGITALHDSEDGEGCFVTSPNLSIRYGNETAGVTLNGSIDNKFSAQKSEDGAGTDNFTQAYKFGVSSYYKNGENLELGQGSNFSFQPNFKMQNHQINLRYKNTNINLNENLRTMPVQISEDAEPEIKTISTTQFGLSQQLGNFNTNASVMLAPEGTTYNVNQSLNYSTSKNNLSLSFTPSVGGSYTNVAERADLYTANTSLNAELRYDNQRGFNTSLLVDESITTQFPTINNSLTTMISTRYKNLTVTVANKNEYFSEQKMNTISAGLNVRGKCGEVGASFSHTRTSMPFENEFGEMSSNATYGNKFVVSAKIFFDTLFSRKK